MTGPAPTLFDRHRAAAAGQAAANRAGRNSTARFRQWRSMVFAGSGPAEGSVGLDPADDGLIVATDRVVRSSRVRLHGSPRRVWKSVVREEMTS